MGNFVPEGGSGSGGNYAKNDVWNGQMRVAQNGIIFGNPVAGGAWDLDGWLARNTAQVADLSITRDTGSDPLLKNARIMTVNTADAVTDPNDLIVQKFILEGYDSEKYLNNTFTVGFRVRSSVTGIHCLAIYNGISTLVAEYAIDAPDTWEYKTVTIEGGTPELLNRTNQRGLQLRWANMIGTNHQTTPNAWNVGNFRGTANQVNDVATVGNQFALEDVTLNLGTTVTQATTTYEQALTMAMRYYERVGFNSNRYPKAQGYENITAQVHALTIPFKVKKRDTPIVTMLGTWDIVNISGQPAVDDYSELGCGIRAWNAAGGTFSYNATATSGLEAAARL